MSLAYGTAIGVIDRIFKSIAKSDAFYDRGDVGECEQRCAALLRENLFYDEAGDILVYLMIQRELYESAIMHYQQILERDPNHYSALSQVSY